MRHLSLITALLLAACSQGPAASKLPDRWTDDTLASVDGVPITTADVELARQGGHGAGEVQGDPVEALIDLELAAARARALGLDDDPAYRAELHRLEAPVLAFQRDRLAARFYDQLEEGVTIDDAAARAYFDANATRIRTEVRVRQILLRDRAAIDAAHAALAAGTPFEEVARAQFPALPPHGKPPWEVGFVRWNQVPEAWRAPLDQLEIGAISDVISGPRGRFWILQVVERRVDDAITFDDVEDVVVAALRADAIAKRRASTELELRAQAQIVRR